jgi:hypothetical protein
VLGNQRLTETSFTKRANRANNRRANRANNRRANRANNRRANRANNRRANVAYPCKLNADSFFTLPLALCYIQVWKII